MLNITFLDGYTVNPGDTTWDAFERLGNFTVYDRTTPDEVLARAAHADILIVNKTRLTADHFDALTRLRLVCVAATGYDSVDVAAAAAHGVTVCNAAGYSTESVAQMTLALLLETTNHVGQYAEANRQGYWSRSKDFCCWTTPLTCLAGKRLGIVGLGHIGLAVARLAQAFGMEVFAATSKSPDLLPPFVTPLPQDELFTHCHVVSLHCPLTPQNAGFVDAGLLHRCHPSLVLINTARGRLVDDEAVASALHDGRLGAYCADVLSEEPPRPCHPLLSAPRAYLTPHIAWATLEARERLMQVVSANIAAFLAGKPQNVVSA